MSFDSILIKLASRCNVNCSYCYWFRDTSVYSTPPFIKDEVIDAFISKLENHILAFRKSRFTCIFHGGEPLLYPKSKFSQFLERLTRVGTITQSKIDFCITTNALLVDADWIRLFLDYDITVTVSIDGEKKVNDQHRVHFDGKGTFDDLLKKIELLRLNQVNLRYLAVANLESNPVSTIDFFVKNLGAKTFDILIPDHTYDDRVPSIADFYIRLFDHWYDNYFDKGIQIRLLNNIVRILFGIPADSDVIGYGPIEIVTLLTDGSLEPLDVVRIRGKNSNKTPFNILDNELVDIKKAEAWMEIYYHSLNLCSKCERCEYKTVCGGGHIASRWSVKNGFDNPSVYCDDLIRIFEHSIQRLSNDVTFMKESSL